MNVKKGVEFRDNQDICAHVCNKKNVLFLDYAEQETFDSVAWEKILKVESFDWNDKQKNVEKELYVDTWVKG